MKILFITHDTSRTGAPMVLLHLLRWLKDYQPNIQADVLALGGGNMESDFKKMCVKFYDYRKFTKKQPLLITQRILKKLKLYKPQDKKAAFLNQIVNNNYKIIYANTVLSIPLGVEIKKANSNSKLIAHVHELQVIIKSLLPDFTSYITYINIVIAPSELVKQNLINRWSIPEEDIKVVHECADVVNLKDYQNELRKKEQFIVGGSGTVHWRKGYDIFLSVANYIKTYYPKADIIFQWIGKLSKPVSYILEEDIRKLQLENKVVFVGEVSNTASYYNLFDLFLMTSREDPFPLVCIEVGLLGKPIISFDQAVGTNEILQEGGGFIVPYLDVVAMAEKVMVYYNQRELIVKHGNKNKIAFSQFTPNQICPQIYEIIDKYII